MSTRNIRGPLYFNATKIVLTGNYTVVNESVVVVNKTVGASTTITLPASSTVSDGRRRFIYVVDGKGDGATNNITIAAAGTDTINGSATYVLSRNYSSVKLVDCGSGVWQATTESDPASTAGSATITNGTVTNLTSTNATITNLTTNSPDINADVGTLAAAGTVIGNAAALTHAFTQVTGANDSAGVILPTAVAGKKMSVYSSQATNGLKIYPPVNGTINDGTANTAIVIEGKTRADFFANNAVNWTAIFTLNT